MVVPVRNLAKYGVVTDPDPYDLPIEAWSFGVNCRFRNGRITRSPVHRGVQVLGTSDPRFLVSHRPTSGLDFVFLGYTNGRLFKYASGAETDWSIAGYVNSVSDATWSTVHLADVLWVNRDDRVPWYLRTSDSQFQAIPAAAAPTGWASDWRAHLLRACGGALVALNVTKGATNYPTMVKTSSIPTSGTVPASWDHTSASTLATENILAEMEGPIVDACPLGNNLFIHGNTDTWEMIPVGAGDVFDYRKCSWGKGSINANCSIEVLGRQYTFGVDDIWMHDGVTGVSIADGRVRDFVYNSINLSKASRCFVVHNPRLKEIHFCYVSGDRKVAFLTSSSGCNRSVVYNYVNDTWTFDDQPLVYSGAAANLSSTLTYATVTTTYDTIGGTYLDQDDGFKRVLCFVGDSNTSFSLTSQLYAFDPFGTGSTVAYAVDTNATQAMYLERDGIDVDELGAPLQGYKNLNGLVVQGRLGADAAALQIAAGSADYFGVDPTFSAYQTWDGNSLYKVDFNSAGRYLSLRILFDDYREVSLSGYDADVSVDGDR
jgi:hypothetical protein